MGWEGSVGPSLALPLAITEGWNASLPSTSFTHPQTQARSATQLPNQTRLRSLPRFHRRTARQTLPIGENRRKFRPMGQFIARESSRMQKSLKVSTCLLMGEDERRHNNAERYKTALGRERASETGALGGGTTTTREGGKLF